MAVIVGERPRNTMLEGFLQQYLANQGASQRQGRELAQNQAQFDTEFGAKKPLYEAQTGAAQANARQSDAAVLDYEEKQKILRGVTRIKDFEEGVGARLKESGDIPAYNAARQQLIASDPDVAYVGTKIQSGPTAMDQARGSAAATTRDATARIAEGGQNPQDRNVYNQLQFNKQLDAPQFADQAARQMGPQRYDEFLEVGAKIRPEANTIEQGRTARAVAGIQASARPGGAIGGGMPGGGSATGDEFLKTLPAPMQSLVKAIAEYKIDPAKATSLRGGHREAVMNAVTQYDPTYDQTQYANRAALRKDFNSGMGARNIRSLNTAIKHLESMADAAEKLDNTRIPAWNAVANTVAGATGDPRMVKFEATRDALTAELAAIFKNTGATDQEIAAVRETINKNMSPAQMQGAVETFIDLMAGRISALESQWKSGMGKPRDFQILSDSSKAILQRLGVNPEVLEGGAGSVAPSAETSGDGRVITDPAEALRLLRGGQ